MNPSAPKSYWRIFNIIFYVTVLLLLIRHAIILIAATSNDKWLIGDWLINYQGGLVRRGLIGEILFRISPLIGIEIGILVVVLQMLLYLIFLSNACFLSINSSFTPLNVMLICSPAFILFPVLYPYGGFRKEILLFALLSALCNRLADINVKIPKYLPACTGLICVVIVLSHEILIAYLPYVICAFIVYDKKLSAEAVKTALFMIPAAIVWVFIIAFGRGDKQVVIDICNSLKTSAPPDCLCPGIGQGAITFLGNDITSAHAFVLDSNPPSTLIVYAVCAILSFTPLVLKLRSKQFRDFFINNKFPSWLAICTCSALIASLPLLWIVADYGRIIYIHVTCLSLLALMATKECYSVPLPFRCNLWHIGFWLLCFLFIISWRLIHWQASPENTFMLYRIINLFW